MTHSLSGRRTDCGSGRYRTGNRNLETTNHKDIGHRETDLFKSIRGSGVNVWHVERSRRGEVGRTR